MIKLGTNILSQKVQRNLGRATSDLSTTSERLSSGLRINKASDDAAGLAIAMSLNTDSRAFSQGIRNLNDGISAVSIAEGAMAQLGSIVERIQELATQSMNGTFSDVQRASMQKEVAAIQAEWNRIVESTSFNGSPLLTGSNTRIVLQGGKGLDGTLAVQIGEEQQAGGVAEYGGDLLQRVNVSSSGVEANSGGSNISLSADGKYAAFTSAASNLVSGDTNGVHDFFVRELATGVTTRVSTSTDGTQANAATSYARLSGNGRYAMFTSLATNLIASDSNGQQDVFLKDLNTGITRIVSSNAQGQLGDGGSTGLALSHDGQFVLFDTFATNLIAGDTNGQRDVFLKNTLTGEISLVSSGSSQVVGNGGSFARALSADGRYAVFSSLASNLVSGDTNGQRDVFVKDIQTGILTRVSTDSNGNQASGYSQVNAISGDGRYVAFWSDAANLVNGDLNGHQDSFVKDIFSNITTRVSTSSQGNEANGDSRVSSISADGRYVAFDSDASNLVGGDSNGQFDSFIKDTISGEVIRLSLSSGGNEGNSLSYEGTLSADGRSALFQSFASNLVSNDSNGAGDVFLRDLTRVGVNQMSGMVVSNRISAGATLTLVQRYREELLDYRSRLGASSSRISSFVNTLQSATINYKAASSRITDADIADESSKSIAAKIRQEVATSLLSQANQAPQIALSLLRGA